MIALMEDNDSQYIYIYIYIYILPKIHHNSGKFYNVRESSILTFLLPLDLSRTVEIRHTKLSKVKVILVNDIITLSIKQIKIHFACTTTRPIDRSSPTISKAEEGGAGRAAGRRRLGRVGIDRGGSASIVARHRRPQIER